MKLQLIKKSPIFLLLALLNIFVSCGSDDDDNGSSIQEEQAGQDDQGTFEAVLNPLNTNAAGTPRGTATVRVRGDDVEVDVDVTGAPRSVMHRQFIYTLGVCPVAANDANLDGYIDFQEARNASANILIPLDNQLNTQVQGGSYPVARRSGSYNYDESASLTTMLADLYAPDPLPTDEVGKLSPGEALNLPGRSVIIHGVSSRIALPTTIATLRNLPRHQTLPIACGTFVRVADNEEPVPVPVPVPAPTPTPPCPTDTTFSTRLNTQLAISGVRCQGGESVEVESTDGTSRIYFCRRNQWLVTVDNVNTCSPDGVCTEIEVGPVIANLRRSGNSNPPEQCTYSFSPVSPTTMDQRTILNSYQVRFYDANRPVVIPR